MLAWAGLSTILAGMGVVPETLAELGGSGIAVRSVRITPADRRRRQAHEGIEKRVSLDMLRFDEPALGYQPSAISRTLATANAHKKRGV